MPEDSQVKIPPELSDFEPTPVTKETYEKRLKEVQDEIQKRMGNVVKIDDPPPPREMSDLHIEKLQKDVRILRKKIRALKDMLKAEKKLNAQRIVELSDRLTKLEQDKQDKMFNSDPFG